VTHCVCGDLTSCLCPQAGSARAKRKASKSDAAVGKGVARKRGRTSIGGAADAAGEASPGPVAAPPRAAGDEEAGDEPDSEDDAEGQHTAADEAFIDDECVWPCVRCLPTLVSLLHHPRGAAAAESDEDGQDGEEEAPAPQAVEARGRGDVDDDIEAMFKPASSRRKGKDEAQRQELVAAASDLVARMQVAADQDASAREDGRVALAKLRMLPEVEQQLRHVDLAPLALEHGLLSVLTAWLRPGEDGSLPNARLRVSLLGLCAHLPIDTRDSLGRDHLKRSGLGKVVMYYKLHDDTPAGRAAAAALVDGWSRPIFELSAAYRDMDASQQEVTVRRGGEGQRSAPQRLAQGDEALGEAGDGTQGPQDPGYRHHAAVPEPAALDYTVRPKSNIVPAARKGADAKGGKGSILKAIKSQHTRKANYAAHKVSVEGRSLVIKSDT
jgi:transcription factor SPN1